jgi:shikimate kinase
MGFSRAGTVDAFTSESKTDSGGPQAVILIGFMGAGKSSVGKALAALLGWTFEDLDDRVERREKRKIHEIFRQAGEAEFRCAERAALQHLLHELPTLSGKVIALGGGAFAQIRNAQMIKAAGIPTLFLDASADELWKRCQRQYRSTGLERPLLNSLVSFRELYEDRRPHYLKATFRHQTGGKTVDKIAAELIDVLQLQPRRPMRTRDKRGDKP